MRLRVTTNVLGEERQENFTASCRIKGVGAGSVAGGVRNVIHRTSHPGIQGGPGETGFFGRAEHPQKGRFGCLFTEPPRTRRYVLRSVLNQGTSGMDAGGRIGATAVFAVLFGTAGARIAFGGQTVSITVTGRDGLPATDVALYLPDVRAPAMVPPAIVDQRDKAFVPAVSVVREGGEVQFTNSDRTSHHVYSVSKPNAFALPLYKGNARLTTRFLHPGVVVLGCNIHDSMLGYVVVVESTRSGTTGADGRLTFSDVPTGRHVVRAWAPGLDRANPPDLGVIDVSDAAPATAAFQLDLTGGAPVPKKRGSLAGSDY